MNLSECATLHIKLFGILREKMDSDNLLISICDTSISLKELRKYLKELYPSLGLNEINFVFAVNKVICKEDMNVKTSDEIAIIQPISGG
jgi:molybdopterin converting factor small subunit